MNRQPRLVNGWRSCLVIIMINHYHFVRVYNVDDYPNERLV